MTAIVSLYARPDIAEGEQCTTMLFGSEASAQ
jgi:hypothetical protein